VETAPADGWSFCSSIRPESGNFSTSQGKTFSGQNFKIVEVKDVEGISFA
jgi:hypothetical protein